MRISPLHLEVPVHTGICANTTHIRLTYAHVYKSAWLYTLHMRDSTVCMKIIHTRVLCSCSRLSPVYIEASAHAFALYTED